MLISVDMNKVYGFEGEAKSKYGDMTYKLFADVFTACKPLPFHSPPSPQSTSTTAILHVLQACSGMLVRSGADID